MTLPKKRNKLWYVLIFVVVVAVVVFILEITDTTHFFHKSPKVSAPTKPISKLTAKPAAEKSPSTASSGVEHGTATDKNGQIPTDGVSSDPSQWASSESGQIVLKGPVKNAKLSPGGTIAGTASSSPVQYRLIDNQVGVISEGSINVVNGNFTASVNFKVYSTTGRLDVFNVDPNGREINEVQVAVTF